MRPEFWQERWRSGQIGFHQSSVDRHLLEFWPRLGVEDQVPVFVPLCGKSLDLLWLRDLGHSVTGVEISDLAIESLCMENGIPARRRAIRGFELYTATGLALFRGDFFALTNKLMGKVAAIYDRAALISWQPERRAAYAEHLISLTSAGTKVLLVALEYPQSQMDGPPFSVTAQTVRQLFGRDFSIQELARRDALADEARLRARGVTELQEICYALVRQ